MPSMPISDQGILELYSFWSEDRYCAGFMHPHEDTVREFREWLRELKFTGSGDLQDYEQEMLEEFYRQEKEDV